MENIPVMIVGRFVIGLAGCGLAAIVVPRFSKIYLFNFIHHTYIVNEISPLQYKATLGSVTQIQILNGVFIAFTMGLGTPETKED